MILIDGRSAARRTAALVEPAPLGVVMVRAHAAGLAGLDLETGEGEDVVAGVGIAVTVTPRLVFVPKITTCIGGRFHVLSY